MKSDPNLKSLWSELKESDFSLMIFLLTSVSSTSSSSRLSILSSWGLAGTKTRLSLLLIRLCLVSFRPIFPRLYFFLRLRVSEVITSENKIIKIQVSDSLLYICTFIVRGVAVANNKLFVGNLSLVGALSCIL